VWFPDDPRQTPWSRFLDEVAAADYSWVELGPFGYVPTDPSRLADELSRRGLSLAGGTVGGHGGLQHRANWSALQASARDVMALTGALGGQHLVLLPEGYRNNETGGYIEPAELDSEHWHDLIAGANELGKLAAEEYGISVDFHPHADSHVETQTQIERFLQDSDPRYVSLCLDTGHIAYRRGDNVALVREFPDRIGYAHIKHVDPDVAQAAAEEDIPFGKAVSRGVCVEPPGGDPNAAEVVKALNELGRELFVVVEQDMYPCPFDAPLPIAIRTRTYLNSIGLGKAPSPR
jgi:inosose dehydratase